MSCILPLALLSVLFLSGCGGPTGPSTESVASGSLSGMVSTRGSGITVELQLTDSVTRLTSADAQGRYTFSAIEPGVYRLFASAPGYSRSALDEKGVVRPGRTTEVGDIVLNWTGIGVPTATLTGVVTDGVSGNPIEDVFLSVACNPHEIICLGRSAFSDAQGRYTISSVPPNFGFDLFIGKTGYPNHTVRGNLLAPDQSLNLTVQMQR